MNAYLAELIGTAFLILLGNGVVANVVLTRTKGHAGGWIVITAGWGIGVFVGAFCSQQYSGAHLNPAVTAAMVIADKLPWNEAGGYLVCQMLGGMLGATLVYLFYRDHYKATEDSDAKLATFCTAPAVRNLPHACFCELVATFALVFPIFLMADPQLQLPVSSLGGDPADLPRLGLGSLGLLPVGLLVFGIGLSLGGTSGYAINPARDLAPRLMHWVLPIPGKRDSDWAYAWVPVLGPLAGGSVAALAYLLLIQAK
ncbi:MAG: aquaporin family protein [Planctomycetaceae bacterium]|nr:aquaporin family protein [Planctomycetaceae bacterium]